MIRQQRLHHDFHLTEIMNPNRTITLHSYARNLEKNKDYPSHNKLHYVDVDDIIAVVAAENINTAAKSVGIVKNDSQRIEEEYFTLVLLGKNCGQHYKLWVQESTEEVFNKIKSIY